MHAKQLFFDTTKVHKCTTTIQCLKKVINAKSKKMRKPKMYNRLYKSKRFVFLSKIKVFGQRITFLDQIQIPVNLNYMAIKLLLYMCY